MPVQQTQRGFTLIELLVVVAIVALVTAGVSLSLRDRASSHLQEEAERLAALLDAARAQSRAIGAAVRWRAVPEGFVFDGLAAPGWPTRWLYPNTSAPVDAALTLGPQPLLEPQAVTLSLATRSLTVRTDGLRPFAVQP